MTNQEAWELIIKWKSLIYKKASRVAGPNYDLIEDVAHNMMLSVYDNIGRGYLSKGTIRNLINFAAGTNHSVLIKNYVSRVSMARYSIWQRNRIEHELLNGTYTGERMGDPTRIEDAIVLVINASRSPYETDVRLVNSQQLYKMPTWLLEPPFKSQEDIATINIDYAVLQLALQRLWNTKYVSRISGYSFYYSLARVYDLEEDMIKILPDVFTEKFWHDNYETEEEAVAEDKRTFTTAAAVSRELGITRERVRQMLNELIHDLHKELTTKKRR